MPSLFRKPGSPYWYAAYRNAAGARIQRTTKKANRTHAWEMALAWERVEKAAAEKRLTESFARQTLSEILERTTGETLNVFTVRNWLAEWLAGKKGTVGDVSYGKYKHVFRDFLELLGKRADSPLAAITQKDIRLFRDHLAQSGRLSITVNQTLVKLGAPFRAAHDLGYIPINPCLAVEPVRDLDSGHREQFTAEQVSTLLKTAEGDWKGAILCGYFTALRLRDVANVTWGDVDLEAGVISLVPRKSRKKRKPVVVPLHPALKTWLKSRTRGIGKAPVFPDLFGRESSGWTGLSAEFTRLMTKAGIKRLRRKAEGAGRRTSNLSFHSLRHSFVSNLANAGVSSELRKRLSGHTSDQSHAIYTHHEVETLRAAVEKLPSV